MVAGNLMLQTEAIEQVLSADAVVMVVKQEYTKKESTYQMKAQVQKLQKPLAAVVLTNVDAIV